MGNSRKKLRIELFFERYFGNFGKLLLTNLLFAIPSAVVFVGLYYLNMAIFQGINIIFSMIAIILLYPFYAGVVTVVRNIVKGESSVPVVKTFFSAIRANFLPFLLHGVAVCAATLLSYSAISVYSKMASGMWIMYVLLFFCIIVVLLALYTSFYLPLMTVTYDLMLRYVYKNSFLMSIGEFKRNIFATLALAIVAGLCLTATAFLPNVTVLLIVASVLWAFFLPATMTFCYVFFVYDGMADMIENKDERLQMFNEKHGKKGARDTAADKPRPALSADDYSDIDISQLKDTDDFIFHNGRMIKQSTLLKILREKEAAKEADHHE